MHASIVRFTLVPLASLLVPPSLSAQEERRDLEGVRQRLAAGLSDYEEARASGAGLDAARSALATRLEELGEIVGGDPLRHTAELGRALGSSRAPRDPAGRGGKVESDVFGHGSFSGAGMGYAYRLPRDYDPTRSYPLILAIPGEDEKPADHIRAQWTLPEILDEAILLSPAMPEREAWDRVMVNGRPGGLCHVLTGLRVATERFAVDFDRVFVVGRGKGVPTAVAAGNYSPQRFVGIIGRAGDATGLPPDNFSNLPTYFAGGGAQARAFAAAAKEAGHDNSVFQADGSEQDIWRWMLDHPRRTYPDRVVLVPGDPFPTRAYWLQVSPSAPQCRATAVIERAANAIRIDTVGIARATVFLNDELVDLSQPVRVVLNGVERSSVVPRHLPTFLDLVDGGTSDPAAVYVARAEYDATGAAAEPDAAPAADAELEERQTAAGSDVGRSGSSNSGARRRSANPRTLAFCARSCASIRRTSALARPWDTCASPGNGSARRRRSLASSGARALRSPRPRGTSSSSRSGCTPTSARWPSRAG